MTVPRPPIVEYGTEFRGTLTSTCPIVVRGRIEGQIYTPRSRSAKRAGMPGEVGFLTVNHVGDANCYVSIHRAGGDDLAFRPRWLS